MHWLYFHNFHFRYISTLIYSISLRPLYNAISQYAQREPALRSRMLRTRTSAPPASQGVARLWYWRTCLTPRLPDRDTTAPSDTGRSNGIRGPAEGHERSSAGHFACIMSPPDAQCGWDEERQMANISFYGPPLPPPFSAPTPPTPLRPHARRLAVTSGRFIILGVNPNHNIVLVNVLLIVDAAAGHSWFYVQESL